jgi:hypothetical protein
VEQLGSLRDPAALPGWLSTTTQRECARVLLAAHHPQAAPPVPGAGHIADKQAEIPEQQLLAAERHATLREALTHLPPRGQQLLTLLSHAAPPDVPASPIAGRAGDRLRASPRAIGKPTLDPVATHQGSAPIEEGRTRTGHRLGLAGRELGKCRPAQRSGR